MPSSLPGHRPRLRKWLLILSTSRYNDDFDIFQGVRSLHRVGAISGGWVGAENERECAHQVGMRRAEIKAELNLELLCTATKTAAVPVGVFFADIALLAKGAGCILDEVWGFALWLWQDSLGIRLTGKRRQPQSWEERKTARAAGRIDCCLESMRFDLKSEN
jgi:hypothetical protein